MLGGADLPVWKHTYADTRPTRVYPPKTSFDGRSLRATHMDEDHERLFSACEHGFLGTATTMIKDNHANINILHCYTDLTPLMVAAQHGRRTVARFLLDQGSKVNMSSPTYKQTALTLAVQGDTPGHSAVAKLLLERGASVWHPYFTGIPSPIVLACKLCKNELVEHLLSLKPFAKRPGEDSATTQAKEIESTLRHDQHSWSLTFLVGSQSPRTITCCIPRITIKYVVLLYPLSSPIAVNKCFAALIETRNADGIDRFLAHGVYPTDPNLPLKSLSLGDADIVANLRPHLQSRSARMQRSVTARVTDPCSPAVTGGVVMMDPALAPIIGPTASVVASLVRTARRQGPSSLASPSTSLASPTPTSPWSPGMSLSSPSTIHLDTAAASSSSRSLASRGMASAVGTVGQVIYDPIATPTTPHHTSSFAPASSLSSLAAAAAASTPWSSNEARPVSRSTRAWQTVPDSIQQQERNNMRLSGFSDAHLFDTTVKEHNEEEQGGDGGNEDCEEKGEGEGAGDNDDDDDAHTGPPGTRVNGIVYEASLSWDGALVSLSTFADAKEQRRWVHALLQKPRTQGALSAAAANLGVSTDEPTSVSVLGGTQGVSADADKINPMIVPAESVLASSCPFPMLIPSPNAAAAATATVAAGTDGKDSRTSPSRLPSAVSEAESIELLTLQVLRHVLDGILRGEPFPYPPPSPISLSGLIASLDGLARSPQAMSLFVTDRAVERHLRAWGPVFSYRVPSYSEACNMYLNAPSTKAPASLQNAFSGAVPLFDSYLPDGAHSTQYREAYRKLFASYIGTRTMERVLGATHLGPVLARHTVQNLLQQAELAGLALPEPQHYTEEESATILAHDERVNLSSHPRPPYATLVTVALFVRLFFLSQLLAAVRTLIATAFLQACVKPLHVPVSRAFLKRHLSAYVGVEAAALVTKTMFAHPSPQYQEAMARPLDPSTPQRRLGGSNGSSSTSSAASTSAGSTGRVIDDETAQQPIGAILAFVLQEIGTCAQPSLMTLIRKGHYKLTKAMLEPIQGSMVHALVTEGRMHPQQALASTAQSRAAEEASRRRAGRGDGQRNLTFEEVGLSVEHGLGGSGRPGGSTSAAVAYQQQQDLVRGFHSQAPWITAAGDISTAVSGHPAGTGTGTGTGDVAGAVPHSAASSAYQHDGHPPSSAAPAQITSDWLETWVPKIDPPSAYCSPLSYYERVAKEFPDVMQELHQITLAAASSASLYQRTNSLSLSTSTQSSGHNNPSLRRLSSSNSSTPSMSSSNSLALLSPDELFARCWGPRWQPTTDSVFMSVTDQALLRERSVHLLTIRACFCPRAHGGQCTFDVDSPSQQRHALGQQQQQQQQQQQGSGGAAGGAAPNAAAQLRPPSTSSSSEQSAASTSTSSASSSASSASSSAQTVGSAKSGRVGSAGSSGPGARPGSTQRQQRAPSRGGARPSLREATQSSTTQAPAPVAQQGLLPPLTVPTTPAGPSQERDVASQQPQQQQQQQQQSRPQNAASSQVLAKAKLGSSAVSNVAYAPTARCKTCGILYVHALVLRRMLVSAFAHRDVLLEQRQRQLTLERERARRKLQLQRDRDMRIGRLSYLPSNPADGTAVAGKDAPHGAGGNVPLHPLHHAATYKTPLPSISPQLLHSLTSTEGNALPHQPRQQTGSEHGLGLTAILRTVQKGRPQPQPLREFLPHPSMIIRSEAEQLELAEKKIREGKTMGELERTAYDLARS